MNTENMLNVTNVDLKRFVKEVYNLSKPVGMGFLHYQPGELTDAEASQIVNTKPLYGKALLSLDYIKGRACKMTVFEDNGQRWINNDWFDHSASDLAKLREVCEF